MSLVIWLKAFPCVRFFPSWIFSGRTGGILSPTSYFASAPFCWTSESAPVTWTPGTWRSSYWTFSLDFACWPRRSWSCSPGFSSLGSSRLSLCGVRCFQWKSPSSFRLSCCCLLRRPRWCRCRSCARSARSCSDCYLIYFTVHWRCLSFESSILILRFYSGL